MTRTSSFQSTDVSFCRGGSRSSDYCNQDPAGSPSTVPVHDPGGRLIAAVSSSGPVEKHPRDEVEGQAQSAAYPLSSDMGTPARAAGAGASGSARVASRG